MINRCNRCMADKGDAIICPNCGYINNSATVNPDYLPPTTRLHQRYELGNLLSYNNESGVYIAYDTQIDTVVEIREFMPRPIAVRNPDDGSLLVEKDHLPLYKQLSTEFIDLNHALSKIRTIGDLVQVYELFTENNTFYVVMEHVEGESLNEYLSQKYGELNLEEALNLFSSTVKSLQKLHEIGLVHGGISPQTLYINRNNQVKIGGFCIPSIRRENPLIEPELFEGYAAPEQYDTDGNSFGPWTDVYAMAAVLYKSLIGSKPSSSHSRLSVDNLVAPNMLNSSIPTNVSVAIMSAMTLSPKLRTQSMTDLYDDLIAPPRTAIKQAMAAKAAGTDKKQPSADAEPEKEGMSSTKKNVLVAMGFTAVVLVILSVFLLFFLFGGRNREEPSSSLGGFSSLGTSTSSDSSDSSASSGSSSENSSSGPSEGYLMFDLINKDYNTVVNNPDPYGVIRLQATWEYHEQYNEGLIFYQSVDPNQPIEQGQLIQVKVSKGSKYRSIPDYNQYATAAEFIQACKSMGIPIYEVKVQNTEKENGAIDHINMTGSIDITTQTLTVYTVENA